MNKYYILKSLFIFFKDRKKYWLLPILIIFSLVAGLLIFAQGSVIAPFIYTLF